MKTFGKVNTAKSMQHSNSNCQLGDVAEQPQSPERRQLLKAIFAMAIVGGGLLRPVFASTGGIEAKSATTTVDESDGLTWLPAWKLREMIVKGEVTSVEVVRHFLHRIEKHDSSLNAFRRLDAQGALEQAALADKAVRAGGPLGSLHGVPIAVKELYTVRGFPKPGSYSSYLTGEKASQSLATRDDIEIERLRVAGAIIVGVTVAAIGPVPGLDVAHLPRNPWDLSCTTGGSSAGNGAAVGAGLVPLALGDDGGGSIRLPSAFCGLLGLHPTRGRVPHVDYKSVAPRATVTAGPMTRNVRDAAVAMQILAGPDGRDFVCLQDQPPDFVGTLNSGINGKRFLWTGDFGFAHMPEALQSPRTVSAVFAATGVLERKGGTVTRSTTQWEDPMPSYLAMKQLTNGTVAPYAEKDLSETEMIAGLECRRRNWQRFQNVFAKHDFILSPTIQFTAPKIDAWVEFLEETSGPQKFTRELSIIAAHTMMCNDLGLPAISIPAGFVDRMPVGLQVIGKPGSEAGLLQVAEAFLTA